MASSSQPDQSPSTAVQPPVLDITYRLISQRIHGQPPGDCNNFNDHVRIKTDITSSLQARLPSDTQFIVCRVFFTWANYSGDMSGAYDKKEDTLISTKFLQETLRKDPTDREISGIKIRLLKERTQDGTLVDNGGRYIRLDVQFAGTPARSAKIWGKKVMGENMSGGLGLDMEEKLRLGIEGKQWRWKAD